MATEYVIIDIGQGSAIPAGQQGRALQAEPGKAEVRHSSIIRGGKACLTNLLVARLQADGALDIGSLKVTSDKTSAVDAAKKGMVVLQLDNDC